MANKAEFDVYRIRRLGGEWFVRVYTGYSFDKHVKDFGPFTFAEADAHAKALDMPDGDKGPEQAHVRGYNATR